MVELVTRVLDLNRWQSRTPDWLMAPGFVSHPGSALQPRVTRLDFLGKPGTLGLLKNPVFVTQLPVPADRTTRNPRIRGRLQETGFCPVRIKGPERGFFNSPTLPIFLGGRSITDAPGRGVLDFRIVFLFNLSMSKGTLAVSGFLREMAWNALGRYPRFRLNGGER